MNDLKRIDTLENGNPLLFYPHNGHLFYFEATSYESIRLYMVDTVEDVEQEYDEYTKFEDLPAGVRRVISTSKYRMQSTVTDVLEAM